MSPIGDMRAFEYEYNFHFTVKNKDKLIEMLK